MCSTIRLDPGLLIAEPGREGEVHEGRVETLAHGLRPQRHKRSGIERGRDIGGEKGFEDLSQTVRAPQRRLEEAVMRGNIMHR